MKKNFSPVSIVTKSKSRWDRTVFYQIWYDSFNINDLHPTCSILIGDFNATHSKWCAINKDNSAGTELDNITTTSGFRQKSGRPTQFVNGSSWTDLTSNVSLTKNCGVEQSLYKKYHHNIIYRSVYLTIP